MNKHILSRAVSASLAVLVAIGCGGADGATGSTTPVLTSITVTLSSPSLSPGQSETAVASGNDQTGKPISVGSIQWTSSVPSTATVSSTGLITAVSPGNAEIIATSGGRTGQTTVTVTPPRVASVTVSPSAITITTATGQSLFASAKDADGHQIDGRAVTWASSNTAVATVSSTGVVQGVGAGVAQVTATIDAVSGSAAVTVIVPPPVPTCAASAALSLAPGEVRTLTAAQISSFCIGAAGDYVVIPFNNSTIPSSTTDVQFTATGVVSIASTRSRPAISSTLSSGADAQFTQTMESDFRAREERDIGGAGFGARALASRRASAARGPARRMINGMPPNPPLNGIYSLNINVTGNTCSDTPTLHPLRVVAVLPHTIVMVDTLSPPGGYTDDELTAFGVGFDTLGFAMDTTNFGANTDIDGNNRVTILFTPGINSIPGPVGGIVGGLFATRDLLPATNEGCVSSNQGEMFYIPVPDPNRTLNGNYATKSRIAQLVLPTLVHEFQHLINAGRRIYVNDALALEKVWLNEGLSHIAEELLYYKISANAPLQNLGQARIRSTQAQVDAYNNNQSQNFGRLRTYMVATTSTSPFSTVDGLEMRGAIWQLLRYAADQKGGDQRQTWQALVNSTTSGQPNFNAVFGDIITSTRDWAVAQLVDDLGFAPVARYTHPSWNFRDLWAALGDGKFPLVMQPLTADAKVQLSLIGGGVGYVSFTIAPASPVTVAGTSAGLPTPANIDVMLVRTR